MQAKLDEEAGQLVQLWQNIEQEWAGRALAGEACHRAQDVQCRTVDDARARLPPASSGVGQNLAAAAILLRAMPEPSTTEGAAYPRRTQESPGGCCGPTGRKLCLPKARVPPRSIAQRLPNSCGRPRSTPGARGTGRLQPRVASATSHTIATVEPASTRGCGEATTPGMDEATTARRIGVPRSNHQVHKPSAGPYDERRSRLGSGPRLPSPSTRGRQGRSCGLRTTGWHASWEGRTMTTSSSTTFPCSSPTLPGPGWSIRLPRRSPTGTTWSGPSLETSRARTCALGTHGISEAAASSQGNPCETTSDGFQSSAPSCPTSPTWMSLGRSSPTPPAETW
jgi:hypothetical protein